MLMGRLCCQVWSTRLFRCPCKGTDNHSAHLQATVQVLGTEVNFYLCQRHGVDFVFVGHPSYLRLGLYGDAFGPFQDNQVLLCTTPILF